MKTKTSTNKLVRLLNKKTVANLNHREMVGINGGEILRQDDGLVGVMITAGCTEAAGGCTPYIPDEPLFPRLTLLKNCQ